MVYLRLFTHLYFHQTTLENNFRVRSSHSPFTKKMSFLTEGVECIIL